MIGKCRHQFSLTEERYFSSVIKLFIKKLSTDGAAVATIPGIPLKETVKLLEGILRK